MSITDDGQLYHIRKCVGEEKVVFKLGLRQQSPQETQHVYIQQLFYFKISGTLSPASQSVSGDEIKIL